MRILPVVIAAFIPWSPLAYAASITAAEAGKHVGESATVCGLVVSAHYAATSKAQPTFLNLDKAYPNQPFTAVIFGTDRPKFSAPETAMLGKHICVTGKIELYRGKSEIIVHEPDQIAAQ